MSLQFFSNGTWGRKNKELGLLGMSTGKPTNKVIEPDNAGAIKSKVVTHPKFKLKVEYKNLSGNTYTI